MQIASLVVKAAPAHIEPVQEALRAIPGVEVHGVSRDLGRLIVTVEDGEGYALADSMVAVNLAPHVQSVTLAYEYTDEGIEGEQEHPEPVPGQGSITAAGTGSAQDKEA